MCFVHASLEVWSECMSTSATAGCSWLFHTHTPERDFASVFGASAATMRSPRSPDWATRRALREVDQLIVPTRLRVAADERATDAGTKGAGATAEGTNFTKKQALYA